MKAEGQKGKHTKKECVLVFLCGFCVFIKKIKKSEKIWKKHLTNGVSCGKLLNG